MSAEPLPTDAAPLPLPRRIGRYTLFDHIGKGGMAEIYLARARTEIGASRLVVLKQILPHLAASRAFTESLIGEAKLAAKLDHANIVQVEGLGNEDGVVFIAMQYVEGLDLNELLRRCAKTKTPLPIECGLLIVAETLRALDYAHRRTTDDGKPLGIVHRDVSPSNVLISFDGEVKLCDFGIARANDVADLLGEEAVKGKAGYMSPEHARGESLDGRADVFAAGIILWELLAGRRLYRTANDAPPLLEQAKAAQIPKLPARGLAHEAELHAIVAKALAPNRDDRYATAQAMLRDLEAYVGKSGLIASALKLSDFLTDHFGADLVEMRRARERAAKALEAGPAASVQPIALAPSEPVADEDSSAPEATGTRPISPRMPAPPAVATPTSVAPPKKGGPPVWFLVAVALVVAGGILAVASASH